MRPARACIGSVVKGCPARPVWQPPWVLQSTPRLRICCKSISQDANRQNRVGFLMRLMHSCENVGKRKSKSSTIHLATPTGKKTNTERRKSNRKEQLTCFSITSVSKVLFTTESRLHCGRRYNHSSSPSRENWLPKMVVSWGDWICFLLMLTTMANLPAGLLQI